MNGVTITIRGDSESQDNDTETISFTGNTKERFIAYSQNQGTRTATSLKSSATEYWTTDLWKGWAVIKGPSGVNQFSIIQENNQDTLFGDFTNSTHWQFQIFKYHANTKKKWKRVTSISANKELHGFDLSFSSFFDTENATGEIATFMPYTDTINDNYRRTMYTTKNINVGTHTLEIFAQDQARRHNFFNVIKVKNPDDIIGLSSLTEGPLFSGTVVDGTQVMFANTGIFNEGATTLNFSGHAVSKSIIFDLAANKNYYLRHAGGELHIATESNGGVLHTSSNNGVIIFNH